MKNLKRLGIRMIVTVAAIFALSVQAFAATGRIAFSDPSAQVGDEVSVNVKFSTDNGEPLGNTDVMLSYDPDMLEYINETDNASGGAGAIRVWTAPDGSSEVATLLRFHALKPGTTTITISSWEAYDNNGALLESVREGSSAITIAALPTSSNDATLSSLSVAPGTLKPAFSPSTESYTVTVGLETTQIAVSAVANNSSATVSLDGGSDLQEGENTVICRVTAQDGATSKDYTITVNRVEGGEDTETAATETEPEVLAELTVTARRIRIIDLPEGVEVPEGFRESSIAIGDTKVPGWTWAADESPRYCVFYGMNDNGEQNFYRYDLTEKTIQRYFEGDNTGAVTEEDYTELMDTYNSLVGDYRMSRILMFVFLAIAVILLIILVVSRRSVASRQNSRRTQSKSRQTYRQSSSARSSRSSDGRKLSKEERYMLGEEDEYDDDDDYEIDYTEEESYSPDTNEESVQYKETVSGDKKDSDDNDDDDFEFFDL